MKCGDAGYIQAYLDGELGRDERKRFARHLESCEICRTMLSENKRLDSWCEDALQESFSLKEAQQVKIDTEAAWRAFRQRIQNERKGGSPTPGSGGTIGSDGSIGSSVTIGSGRTIESRMTTESKKFGEERTGMKRRYRKWAAAAAATALLAGALSIPRVQAMAESVLSMFRVDKVEFVKVTQSDLQEMENWLSGMGEPGMKELAGIGKIWVDDQGRQGSERERPRFFDSIAAAKEAGYTPPAAPEGYEAQTMDVHPSWTLRVQLDTEKANRLLKQLKADVQFDDAINHKQFSFSLPEYTVTEFAAVHPAPGEPSRFRFYVSDVPIVSVPEGVNLDQLRSTFLQLPFIPQNVKQQLAGIEDWKRTLPVPYIDGETNMREVSVQGSQGLLAGDRFKMLMWQKDGKLFRIECYDAQNVSDDALIELAGKMQ